MSVDLRPGDLFRITEEHPVLYGLDYAASPVAVSCSSVFMVISVSHSYGPYSTVYTFNVDLGLRFAMARQCTRV